MMERVTWTDERLDDRFDGLDGRFDRVDAELLQLRREMQDGFGVVRGELAGVRNEVADLRTTLTRAVVGVGGSIVVGLIGVIAAILSRGA